MRILGLHFGHDAGVSLIEDGHVRFHAQCERLVREKHVTGLSYETVREVLEHEGITPEQIDFCAITSTQAIDLVFDKRKPFTVDLVRHPRDSLPSTLELTVKHHVGGELTARQILHPSSLAPQSAARVDTLLRGTLRCLGLSEENAQIVPWLNRGLLDVTSVLGKPRPLLSLADDLPSSLGAYAASKHNFNYPVTLSLDGHRIPAAYVSHHAAHAAATYYQSPYRRSAIATLDGGNGLEEGGLFWLGDEGQILPLRVHYLDLGRIYMFVSNEVLRLGGSAEGKMMGLAPYGQPMHYHERFIGNFADLCDEQLILDAWYQNILNTIKTSPRYVAADLGNPERMTTSVNADIAASTQKLFEETMLVAVQQLSKIMALVGTPTPNLSLSGGCMLNCPTNTRISQETAFRNVYVEPACDDGGLPSGAALWVYHNLMQHPRVASDPVQRGVPYLGLTRGAAEIASALAAFAEHIEIFEPDDLAKECARRLAAGQVVGWFEGRSEIGPRALGHRSIVADPRSAETWQRVNTIKGRELWRPLAPSVLQEFNEDWFTGLPASSPFMMFVGTVKQPTVPAISHIDGTARVQTVTKECGGYYKLIKHFHALTGCPVVLNTSMNGPGEPIAEYPADAVKMLLDGRFDVLAIGEQLVVPAAEASNGATHALALRR